MQTDRDKTSQHDITLTTNTRDSSPITDSTTPACTHLQHWVGEVQGVVHQRLGAHFQPPPRLPTYAHIHTYTHTHTHTAEYTKPVNRSRSETEAVWLQAHCTAHAPLLIHCATHNGVARDAVVVKVDLIRLQQQQGEPAGKNAHATDAQTFTDQTGVSDATHTEWYRSSS